MGVDNYRALKAHYVKRENTLNRKIKDKWLIIA